MKVEEQEVLRSEEGGTTDCVIEENIGIYINTYNLLYMDVYACVFIYIYIHICICIYIYIFIIYNYNNK